MLTEGLFALLSACTPLTTLVGTRIYQVVLPKNPTVPALTYYVVDSKQDAAMDSTALVTTRVDINLWANTYHDAAYAQAAVHTLLDLFAGKLSDGTVVICTTSNDNPDFREPDSLLYRCSTTFIFQHT